MKRREIKRQHKQRIQVHTSKYVSVLWCDRQRHYSDATAQMNPFLGTMWGDVASTTKLCFTQGQR